MNNLSWFIYLTQVADSVSSTFVFVGVAFIVVCAGRFIATAIRAENAWVHTTSSGGADVAARKEVWAAFNPQLARYIGAATAAFLIAAIIPSRQTMLLIAGSEMGERIVKSDAVKDIVNPGADLLKAWIKDETDKITNKKK